MCNDIETNPGPPMYGIDPTLTIKAPYSQGDIMYFGENAGKQCVAMSLIALIYNKIKGIHTCDDLVQILEMDNQLYSTLSQCTGQVYLMQTEVPSMIALSEENYQLNYSEGYTGNLHHCNSIIKGYQYSMSIDRAFESLLSQNYSSFILTIECIGVSIYHTDNGSYKIFESHARDEYGRSHPSGTCVLLEVPSTQGLVQYFQTIHSVSDNYELRGVQISTYEVTRVNNLREEHNCSCKQCFAVGLYAIFYSVAKSCSYWNSRTLHCIADQGNKLYHNMGINRCLKMADLYTSLDICGVEISVQLKAQSYGMLSTSLNNTKNKLENLIFNNYSGNTGFPLRNGFWNSLEFLGFS